MFDDIQVIKNRLDSNSVGIRLHYKDGTHSRVLRIRDLEVKDTRLVITRENNNKQNFLIEPIKELEVRFYYKNVENFLDIQMKSTDSLEKAKTNYVFVRKYKLNKE